jgi:hypothetical protein
VREPGVRILAALPGGFDPVSLGLQGTQYGVGREQVALSTRALSRNPLPNVAAGHHLAVAIAQAQRGAWDSSLVALDGFIAGATDPGAALYPYRMAVVGAWLGALTPEVAASRRGGGFGSADSWATRPRCSHGTRRCSYRCG